MKCLAPHPLRRDPCFLTLESVAFFLSFFFIIPGILSNLDILFSNSLVSWLRLDRKEKEGCGRWTVGGWDAEGPEGENAYMTCISIATH